MFTTRKIALGIAGGALVIGSAFGVAALASAETPEPTPAAGSTWQRGGGFGHMGGTEAGTAGMRNGAGYGATENAQYLAEKLGVSQDAVTAALQKYHADSPAPVRGQGMTDEEQAARHDALATYLAGELKVDKQAVLDALNAKQGDRREARTAQREARLAEAVASGRLTQEQADAMTAAHEAGEGMGRMGRMGGGMGGGPRR